MEFQTTKDKIAQRNKMSLFLNKIKKNILTLLGSCCPCGLFRRFWGVFRRLSQLSIDFDYRKPHVNDQIGQMYNGNQAR